MLLLVSLGGTAAAQSTFSGTGNWSTPANWSSGVPTSAVAATIASGANCTVDVAAQCASLTFAAINASSVVTISGTNSITTLGAITMPRPAAGFTGTVNIGGGTITCGSIALSATTAGRNDVINISTGTLTVSGNITTGGVGCQIVFSAAGTLNAGGNFLSGTQGTFTCSTSTVNFNGAGQTINPFAYTFNNVIISGSGTQSVGANLTVGGNLTVNDAATLSIGAFTIAVTGTTTIGNGTSGTLTIGSTTGTKTFSGAVTINNGAIFTETVAEALSFGSDVTNNGTLTENGAATVGIAGSFANTGTYTASTGAHTFSGSTKTISGTISIPSVTVSGSYTNSGNLTVGTTLAGATGTLANSNTLSIGGTCSIGSTSGGLSNSGIVAVSGSGAISTLVAGLTNTGTINLNGSGTIAGITNNTGGIVNLTTSGTIASFNNATSTSTLNISAIPVPTFTALTVTAVGNTVNYSGGGAQTVKAVAYSNLTLSGSGAKTITGVTVNNILDMAGSATASVAPTYGGSATLQYDQTVTAGLEWITPFVATGGVVINSGTVTLGAAKVLGNNTNVPLNIKSGATLTPGTNLLTFDGNFVNAGTLTSGSGGITIAGTFATQSIAGFTTTGNVSCTKTVGTATISGAVTAANLSVSGAGGTLVLSAANTFSGTITLSAGTAILGNVAALGAAGKGVTLSGSVLDLATNSSSNAYNITVSGNSTITSDLASTGAGITHTLGTLVFSGAFTLTIAGGANVNSGTAGVTFGNVTHVAVTTYTVNNPAGGGSTQLSLGAVTNSTFLTTFGGAGNVVQTGVFGAGSGGITYNGAGTLTLNQSNTFTGALQVNSGTVVGTSVAGALGAGSLTLQGGVLKLTNASGSNLNFGRNTTVTGTAQITSDVTASGNGNTYTLGTLTIGANILTIAGGTNVNGGTAGVTFGNVTHSAAPTYTVNNPAGGGVTQLSVAAVANSTFLTTMNGSGNVIQTGVFGNGSGGISYGGTGTLTLNQANTFTGALTISGGMVVGTSVAGALGAGTLTMSGGILKLTNASGSNLSFGRNTTLSGNAQIISDVTVASTAGNTYTLGTLSIANNTLSIVGGANVNSGTAGVTFGNLTHTNAPTYTVNNPASGGVTQLSVAAVSNSTFLTTINGNGNVIQTGVFGNGSGGISYSGTGILTLNQANTFTGALTVSSGTVIGTSVVGALGAGTLTLSGGVLKLTNASGTNLNFGRNTTVNGSAQITTDVTVASTAGNTYTLGTLSIGNNTLTIAGGVNVNSGTAGVTFGAVTHTAAPTYTVNNPVGGGVTQLSLAAVSNSTFLTTFNGSGNVVQTGVFGAGSGGITYGGTGALSLSQVNTYTGGTTISSGTLNINNASALGTIAGTFTIGGGTINASTGPITTVNYPLALNGDFIFTGSNTLNLGTGAVTMNSSRQVTVSASTLTIGGTFSSASNSLTKLGAGILSFGSTAVTLKGLTITSGSLISTSGTLSVAGDFSNSSTFTHNSGTVTFNGGSAQNIAGTAATTFNNLTISNSAGVTLGGTSVNETVAGTLNLTSGNISTGANTLIISNNAVGAISHTSGQVVGKLQRAIATGSSLTYPYYVGTASSYTPVSILFAQVNTGGTLTANVTSGQESNAPIPVDPSGDVNAYWTLTNSGVVFTNYTPTFTYNTADINGGGSSNTGFVVGEYASSAWTTPTPVVNGGSGPWTTSVSGINGTGFGDFVIGPTFASLATDYFRSVATGNWSAVLTWQGSHDNAVWGKATSTPTSSAALATIQSPNTVTVDVNNQTANSIVIASGSTLANSGSNIFLVSGDWTNNGGTFTPAGGTVTFNGGSLQHINGSAATQTFNNMTINGAGGVAVGGSTTTLNISNAFNETSGNFTAPATMSVTGALTMTAGTFTAGTNLIVSGNWSDNGATFTAGSGTVTFNGSSAQTINGSAASQTFNNLAISNSSGVVFGGSGAFSVGGSLTIGNGQSMELPSSPTFTIQSGGSITTTGTGKIIIDDGASYINLTSSSPTLQAKRTLTGSEGWRMLAAPDNVSVGSMFASPLVTQGFTGSSYSTFQPTLLWWDETDQGTSLEAWREPSSTADAVTAGRGYMYYVFNGAQKPDLSGNYSDVLPITMSALGAETPLASAFDYGVTATTRTGSGSPPTYVDTNYTDYGWNLVGNPTPSTIDWDASSGWTKTNMDGTIYIWDPADTVGGYKTWNGTTGNLGSGKIAPFQAFWVKANNSSPSLQCANGVKSTGGVFLGKIAAGVRQSPTVTGDSIGKQKLSAARSASRTDDASEKKDTAVAAKPSVLKLDLSANGLQAHAYLMFSANGKVTYDPYDAFSLVPLSEKYLIFYSVAGEGQPAMQIQDLPDGGYAEPFALPLYVGGSAAGQPLNATFTVKWKFEGQLPTDWKILLMDDETSNAYTMTTEGELTFAYNTPASLLPSGNSVLEKQTGLSSSQRAIALLSRPAAYKVPAASLSKTASASRFRVVISGNNAVNGYFPSTPELSQNYPNPFNPTTNISFSIPAQTRVTIEVFNVLGQKVSTLSDQQYAAGSHVIVWNASRAASGVYFCRMTTADKMQVKKMLLIR